MQETTLVTPTIRLAEHADETLRQIFELPTNAHVARHLNLDPSQWSRVHRQRCEISSQLFARLVLALGRVGESTTDVIEVVDADDNPVSVGITWQLPAPCACARKVAS